MAQEFDWNGRTALITGVTGFIGCWLAEKLIERGVKVVGFDMSEAGAMPLHLGLMEKITFIKGTILDQAALEKAFKDNNVSVCFHLAGQSMIEVGEKAASATFDVNARGTWTVLEAARAAGVDRTVVSSSNTVYGDQTVFPTTEDAALNGDHPYAASKVCTDVITRSYAKSCNMNAVACRQTNTYGGGDYHLTHIVTSTVLSLLKGEQPVIKSDGTPTKAYLYVEDTAEGYIRLAERANEPGVRGEAFNITCESVSVLDLVKSIIAASGSTVEPSVVGTPENTRHDLEHLSMDKSAKVIDWKYRFPLNEGIQKTFDWYKDNMALVEKYGRDTTH